MLPTASHPFFVIAMTVLFVIPATGEEPDLRASNDSAWTKVCSDETCFVGSDRRSYCGLIAGLALIERQGDGKRVLSVTLPTSINPERGARITIGNNQPISLPLASCNLYSCRADYEAEAELIAQLKQEQVLVLEADNRTDPPIVAMMTLAGFAEAYDGLPTPLPAMKFRMMSPHEMEAEPERSKHVEEQRKRVCG